MSVGKTEADHRVETSGKNQSRNCVSLLAFTAAESAAWESSTTRG